MSRAGGDGVIARPTLLRLALACFILAGALLYAMIVYGQDARAAVGDPGIASPAVNGKVPLLTCERELIETRAALLQARLQILQIEHAAKVAEIKAADAAKEGAK